MQREWSRGRFTLLWRVEIFQNCACCPYLPPPTSSPPPSTQLCPDAQCTQHRKTVNRDSLCVLTDCIFPSLSFPVTMGICAMPHVAFGPFPREIQQLESRASQNTRRTSDSVSGPFLVKSNPWLIQQFYFVDSTTFCLTELSLSSRAARDYTWARDSADHHYLIRSTEPPRLSKWLT